jgi:hypothetical protein
MDIPAGLRYCWISGRKIDAALGSGFDAAPPVTKASMNHMEAITMIIQRVFIFKTCVLLSSFANTIAKIHHGVNSESGLDEKIPH